MITYITAFIFYTLAMIGILLIGFVVYKKMFLFNKQETKGSIKIIDSISIGPKKTLLVVRVKNEKFLIASGAEHTTFLAKLSDKKENEMQINVKPQEADNDIHDENNVINLKRSEMRFDDRGKTKLDELQRRFFELYAQNDKNNDIKNEEQKNLIKTVLGELYSKEQSIGAKING